MVRRKARGRSSGSRRSSSNSLSSKRLGSEHSNRTEVVYKRRFKRRKNRIDKEIRSLRRSTKLLIPKAPFVRVVRDVIVDIFPRLDIRRIQVRALEALQEAAEMYIVQFYEDSILLSYHANRVTLMQRDMVMLRRLRGRDDVINR